MKSFILWTLGIAFMALAMEAVRQNEWTIALVMGLISVAAVWAAPSGSKSGDKKTKSAAAADRW